MENNEIKEITKMENSENNGKGKRLTKSKNKMLCGVCGGIAEYFNIDATVVRLIVVFLALAFLGLTAFWDFIEAYELSRPKNTISQYVQQRADLLLPSHLPL